MATANNTLGRNLTDDYKWFLQSEIFENTNEYVIYGLGNGLTNDNTNTYSNESFSDEIYESDDEDWQFNIENNEYIEFHSSDYNNENRTDYQIHGEFQNHIHDSHHESLNEERFLSAEVQYESSDFLNELQESHSSLHNEIYDEIYNENQNENDQGLFIAEDQNQSCSNIPFMLEQHLNPFSNSIIPSNKTILGAFRNICPFLLGVGLGLAFHRLKSTFFRL